MSAVPLLLSAAAVTILAGTLVYMAAALPIQYSAGEGMSLYNRDMVHKVMDLLILKPEVIYLSADYHRGV